METPNLNYIEKLAANDEKLKQKLIDILQFELPTEIDAYFANIKGNNLQQAAFHVHKIKHKIAILGFEEKYLMAEKYEFQLAENKRELQTEFEDTLALILNFINSL